MRGKRFVIDTADLWPGQRIYLHTCRDIKTNACGSTKCFTALPEGATQIGMCRPFGTENTDYNLNSRALTKRWLDRSSLLVKVTAIGR
jgi:hypothetical protein